MPDETARSTSGEDSVEEQKPSPEEYSDGSVSETGPTDEEEADRSSRHAEAASPPRGDPGPPSDA